MLIYHGPALSPQIPAAPREVIVFVARPLLIAALATLMALGCPGPRGPVGPTRPHAEWTGDQAQLLDDDVDAGALQLEGTPARDRKSEAKIPLRLDASDAAVVAKVIAVSSEPVGAHARFRLELAVVETLAGTPSEGSIVLKVEPTSPSFGAVRSVGPRLIGRKLVVFYRQYVAEDGGDPITHFHLSAATEPLLEAVRAHARDRRPR